MDHHLVHDVPVVPSSLRNNDCASPLVTIRRNPSTIVQNAPRKVKKQRPAYFINQSGYSTHQAPRPRRSDVGSACRDLKPLDVHRAHKVSPLSEDYIDSLLAAPSIHTAQPSPNPAPRVATSIHVREEESTLKEPSLNFQFNLLEQLSSCSSWSEVKAALPEEYRHLVPDDDPSIDFCDEFETLCDMYDDLCDSNRLFDEQDFKVYRPDVNYPALDCEIDANPGGEQVHIEEKISSTSVPAPTHPQHGVGGVKRLRPRTRRCLFPRRMRSTVLLRNNWAYSFADTANTSKGDRTERLLKLATSLAGLRFADVVCDRLNSGFMETHDGLGFTPGE